MTATPSQTLAYPAYEIGDETHRKLVAKLRGLPDTMPWDEIDRIRHEEQRLQLVASRGLPETTTWEEIRQIDTRDYYKQCVTRNAQIEAVRLITAVGLGLDENASWKTINYAHKKPKLTERLQISKLKELYKLTAEVHMLQSLLDLPDTRKDQINPELT